MDKEKLQEYLERVDKMRGKVIFENYINVENFLDVVTRLINPNGVIISVKGEFTDSPKYEDAARCNFQGIEYLKKPNFFQKLFGRNHEIVVEKYNGELHSVYSDGQHGSSRLYVRKVDEEGNRYYYNKVLKFPIDELVASSPGGSKVCGKDLMRGEENLTFFISNDKETVEFHTNLPSSLLGICLQHHYEGSCYDDPAGLECEYCFFWRSRQLLITNPRFTDFLTRKLKSIGLAVNLLNKKVTNEHDQNQDIFKIEIIED